MLLDQEPALSISRTKANNNAYPEVEIFDPSTDPIAWYDLLGITSEEAGGNPVGSVWKLGWRTQFKIMEKQTYKEVVSHVVKDNITSETESGELDTTTAAVGTEDASQS